MHLAERNKTPLNFARIFPSPENISGGYIQIGPHRIIGIVDIIAIVIDVAVIVDIGGIISIVARRPQPV